MRKFVIFFCSCVSLFGAAPPLPDFRDVDGLARLIEYMANNDVISGTDDKEEKWLQTHSAELFDPLADIAMDESRPRSTSEYAIYVLQHVPPSHQRRAAEVASKYIEKRSLGKKHSPYQALLLLQNFGTNEHIAVIEKFRLQSLNDSDVYYAVEALKQIKARNQAQLSSGSRSGDILPSNMSGNAGSARGEAPGAKSLLLVAVLILLALIVWFVFRQRK